MNLVRHLLFTILYIPYGFHKLTGTGPFGKSGARIAHPSAQKSWNRLKSALWQYHVKQYHESSCSVASVVSVVNALRLHQLALSTPISQMDLLEKVKTANWKERMSEKGHKGRRGLPLSLLGAVVKNSLDAYGITYRAVHTIQAEIHPRKTPYIKENLRRQLTEFETRGNGLLIAHFDQGVYARTLNIPHISPVGGFNAETGEVVLLDVDSAQEAPYSVSFQRFYRGMASNYHHIFRPFGYGRGGYVYIRI